MEALRDGSITEDNTLKDYELLMYLRNLFNCNIIVGQEPNQVVLKVHKQVLSAASSVFRAMFHNTMINEINNVTITDVEPEIFKALIKFIYVKDVHFNSFEFVLKLCRCANKYKVENLIKKCVQFLCSHLTVNEACRVYELSKTIHEPELEQKSFLVICTSTYKVFRTKDWRDIQQETLLTILEQEKLHIPSELALLRAVVLWGRSECVRRSLDPKSNYFLRIVINDALRKIRFLAMKPQHIVKVLKTEMITQKEFCLIMKALTTGNKALVPKKFNLSDKQRVF